MELFDFSLLLSDADINTPDLENKLFESDCDDALICMHYFNFGITGDFKMEYFNSDIMTADLLKNLLF